MWIEISGVSGIGTDSVSLPLRECGLKSCRLSFIVAAIFVTPLAGVWIEIMSLTKVEHDILSLPLRECDLLKYNSSLLTSNKICHIVTKGNYLK